MKIGIDIDGVIFETSNSTKFFTSLYDLVFLKLVPHKKDEKKTERRYQWIKKHFGKIEQMFLKPLTKSQAINNGAKTMINLLKRDNNTVYAVSARGTSKLCGGERLSEIAIKSLKEEKLEFDDYLWGYMNKAKICKEIGIDVMLEDSYETCRNLAKQGIHSIYFGKAITKQTNPSIRIHPVTNCIEAFYEVKKIAKIKEKEFRYDRFQMSQETNIEEMQR